VVLGLTQLLAEMSIKGYLLG